MLAELLNITLVLFSVMVVILVGFGEDSEGRWVLSGYFAEGACGE